MECKTAALVLKGTSFSLLKCINVVIFVGVGEINVNPRFSLQVPPLICYMFKRFFLFYIYILSGDVS